MKLSFTDTRKLASAVTLAILLVISIISLQTIQSLSVKIRDQLIAEEKSYNNLTEIALNFSLAGSLFHRSMAKGEFQIDQVIVYLDRVRQLLKDPQTNYVDEDYDASSTMAVYRKEERRIRTAVFAYQEALHEDPTRDNGANAMDALQETIGRAIRRSFDYREQIIHQRTESLNNVIGSLQRTVWVQMVILGVGLMLAILVGWWSSQKLATMFGFITRATDQLGQGKLSYRIDTPFTDDLGKVATGIDGLAEKLSEAKVQREQIQRELIITSHNAGMAEVATGVLHNVGNVLNSVNVSAGEVARHLHDSRTADLVKLAQLVDQFKDDLGPFMTDDPRGKALPQFLLKLSGRFQSEQESMLGELAELTKNIDHIKQIVTMQQTYAKSSGVTQSVLPADLFTDALSIHEEELGNNDIQVICQYSHVPEVVVDQHKVLQILINLIGNAKHAMANRQAGDRQLTLRIGPLTEEHVLFHVQDTGVGISVEQMAKLFTHGYTTKKNGHGFGLHSGALAAKQMGGSLEVASSGQGQGATFTLKLPHHLEVTHAA